MIAVESSKRPSCKTILNCKLVQNKKSILFGDTSKNESSILLNTIEFPKNLTNLTARLPKSKYETEDFKNPT